MPGTNLKSKQRFRTKKLFWKYMIQLGPGSTPANKNRMGRSRQAKYPTWLSKAGVPASNVAADAPDRAGQICVDTVGKDCYLCTAFVTTTNHTWTKISD